MTVDTSSAGGEYSIVSQSSDTLPTSDFDTDVITNNLTASANQNPSIKSFGHKLTVEDFINSQFPTNTSNTQIATDVLIETNNEPILSSNNSIPSHWYQRQQRGTYQRPAYNPNYFQHSNRNHYYCKNSYSSRNGFTRKPEAVTLAKRPSRKKSVIESYEMIEPCTPDQPQILNDNNVIRNSLNSLNQSSSIPTTTTLFKIPPMIQTPRTAAPKHRDPNCSASLRPRGDDRCQFAAYIATNVSQNCRSTETKSENSIGSVVPNPDVATNMNRETLGGIFSSAQNYDLNPGTSFLTVPQLQNSTHQTSTKENVSDVPIEIPLEKIASSELSISTTPMILPLPTTNPVSTTTTTTTKTPLQQNQLSKSKRKKTKRKTLHIPGEISSRSQITFQSMNTSNNIHQKQASLNRRNRKHNIEIQKLRDVSHSTEVLDPVINLTSDKQCLSNDTASMECYNRTVPSHLERSSCDYVCRKEANNNIGQCPKIVEEKRQIGIKRTTGSDAATTTESTIVSTAASPLSSTMKLRTALVEQKLSHQHGPNCNSIRSQQPIFEELHIGNPVLYSFLVKEIRDALVVSQRKDQLIHSTDHRDGRSMDWSLSSKMFITDIVTTLCDDERHRFKVNVASVRVNEELDGKGAVTPTDNELRCSLEKKNLIEGLEGDVPPPPTDNELRCSLERKNLIESLEKKKLIENLILRSNEKKTIMAAQNSNHKKEISKEKTKSKPSNTINVLIQSSGWSNIPRHCSDASPGLSKQIIDPSIAVLDEDLRNNFNLSSFLFATTPHLIRSVPQSSLLSKAEIDFFNSISSVHRLGHIAATEIISAARNPACQISKSCIEENNMKSSKRSSLEQIPNVSNSILSDFLEENKFGSLNQNCIMVNDNEESHHGSIHSSDLELIETYSNRSEASSSSHSSHCSGYKNISESLSRNLISDLYCPKHKRHTNNNVFANSDADDDLEDLPVFETNFVPIHSSTITKAQNGKSLPEWFSCVGIDKQSSLAGLLDGLGLTSHIFNSFSSYPSRPPTPLNPSIIVTDNRSLQPQGECGNPVPSLESTNDPNNPDIPQHCPNQISSKCPNQYSLPPKSSPLSSKPLTPSSNPTSFPSLTSAYQNYNQGRGNITTIPSSSLRPKYPRRWPPRLRYRLSSLWDSLDEASCFGIQSPCVDIEDGAITQAVFVPSLSAIQLVALSTSVQFSYFESKPPHVRRPLSAQLRRLASGLEVPVSSDQRKLLIESTSDQLDKEESWMAIYWLPLQQKEITKTIPPAFLIFYTFAITDDPIVMPHCRYHHRGSNPIDSRSSEDVNNAIDPNNHYLPVAILNKPSAKSTPSIHHSHNLQSLNCLPILLPKQPSELDHIPSTQIINPNSGTTSSQSINTSIISTLASARLSGLINATPQLIRFGILPHRPDIKEWGVQSSTTYGSYPHVPSVDKTISSLTRVVQSLQTWINYKNINHPDFEFVRRRLRW